MLKRAKEEARQQDESPSRGKSARDMAESVLESSREIWLAGLGAFSRAQQEGAKVFETLVRQGQELESRTRSAAALTASAARDAATGKAREMQKAAGGTWDKLEQVFEDRVARALSRLGVYTQNDVNELAARVDALSIAVNELVKSNARASSRSPAKKAANARAARDGKPSGSAAAGGEAARASRGSRTSPTASHATKRGSPSGARKASRKT